MNQALSANQAGGAITDDSPRRRVVRRLKQAITRGDLGGDDYLPSERLIAQRLNVARGTVRSALVELEAEGWIVTDSKRRRVPQATATAPAPAVMHDVLAVLTTAPGKPDSQHQTTGWERYIEYGAMDAIRAAGYHALWLEPSRLGEPGAAQAGMSPPAGIVAGREAARSASGLAWLRQWHEQGLPVVVYGDAPGTEAYDHVVSDHAAGADALATWLAGQGRRRILRVWHGSRKGVTWLNERDRGFAAAITRAGLAPLPPIYIYGDSPNPDHDRNLFDAQVSLVTGYLLPHFRSDTPPDAIMCISDGDVFTAAAACRRLGIEPGRDVLIVGYDNYWRDADERFWEPSSPAATVDKNNPAIGAALVDLLLQRLRHQAEPAPQQRLVIPRLVLSEA